MARPNIPLNEEHAIKLAEQLWTNHMIGAFFGVNHQTIARRFGPKLDAARQTGKSKLVSVMWDRVPRSDTVLIHALDRYLGKVANKLEITNEELVGLVEAKLGSSPEEDS